MFVWSAPDAAQTSGELLYLDIAHGLTTDLHVRTALSGKVVLKGAHAAAVGTDGQGHAGLFAAALDGSSAVLVTAQPGDFSFSTEGSRLFYAASGEQWVSCADGASPLDLGPTSSVGQTFLSPDGKVLFVVSRRGTGTTCVELP